MQGSPDTGDPGDPRGPSAQAREAPPENLGFVLP